MIANRKTASRIVKDERGTGAIEFVIVAPVLITMVVGIADLGRGFANEIAIQQAADRTVEQALLDDSELGKVPPAGATNTDFDYLEAEAEAAVGPPGDATVTKWVECNHGAVAPWTSTCPTGQETARYVRVAITTRFKPIFTSLLKNVNAAGEVTIGATSTQRVF